MRVNKTLSRGWAAGAILAVSLAVLASGQSPQSGASSRIRIKNFGCLNENYYRGAQPKGQDYADLAALGIKTVIDLQRDGRKDEQQMVESHGMKFYRIGLTTSSAPDKEQVALFLKLVDDPANQPVFIHCHGGRHRTGIMTAVYRFTHDSWTADRALTEMKQYDFGNGHSTLKEYVFDYYSNMDRGDQAARAATSSH
ncbi:MAG TPA: tyrosine-protein phosphatase [Blastocatellia bacterium]|nr:tyrosine-protein phosphatase [Blastocatellia bacterium]